MSAPDALRFLVVDGLVGVQQFARQLLDSYGFDPEQVRTCGDPETALTLARDFRPDFLITDSFGKSALNGMALYEQVKGLTPACRLGLMSFELTPELEAQAREAGSRFLLKKPFSAQELKTAMHQALEDLARERPDLHQRLQKVMGSAKVTGRVSASIAMPVMPVLRPGDKVTLDNRTEVVETVVIRQGELVVQLKNKSGLIPASKLQKA